MDLWKPRVQGLNVLSLHIIGYLTDFFLLSFFPLFLIIIIIYILFILLLITKYHHSVGARCADTDVHPIVMSMQCLPWLGIAQALAELGQHSLKQICPKIQLLWAAASHIAATEDFNCDGTRTICSQTAIQCLIPIYWSPSLIPINISPGSVSPSNLSLSRMRHKRGLSSDLRRALSMLLCMLLAAARLRILSRRVLLNWNRIWVPETPA